MQKASFLTRLRFSYTYALLQIAAASLPSLRHKQMNQEMAAPSSRVYPAVS